MGTKPRYRVAFIPIKGTGNFDQIIESIYWHHDNRWFWFVSEKHLIPYRLIQ